jgi:predicted TIM-barrel fold metal-dependent hydrolase
VKNSPSRWPVLLSAVGTFAVLPGLSGPAQTKDALAQGTALQTTTLADFARLKPIDAHVHVYNQDAAFPALLTRLDMRVLNICVIDDREKDYRDLEPQRSQVLQVRRNTSGRAAFCTSFSPYDFEDPSFSRRVIKQLDEDFAAGAVAVKIYKTIGMEIKTKGGKFLMADDPVFDPIYVHIAACHKTVVAHLAEPSSCWEPPNPASFDYGYYQKYPAEYAYLHPEYPSKAAILAARDHILSSHPQLLLVGAHLGSMEREVEQIARRFDQYPNFAVDTAARVPYLMIQPREKVKAFLVKYQDRVLYGTDGVFEAANKTDETLRKWTDTYERDWRYFSTGEAVEYRGHKVQGLQLPEAVLRKLYRDNALRWLPGIAGK